MITQCSGYPIKRKQELQAQEQARSAPAFSAGARVFIERGPAFATVAFPDYPGRGVVAGLRRAGFTFNMGRWVGPSGRIPAEVLSLVSSSDAPPAQNT